MRAVVMRDKKLLVDSFPDPEPAAGEVLVKTLACGICGSDLHALKHAERMVANSKEAGAPFVMDLSRDIVMGHEFCAEVLDYGPGTAKRFRAGTRVVLDADPGPRHAHRDGRLLERLPGRLQRADDPERRPAAAGAERALAPSTRR